MIAELRKLFYCCIIYFKKLICLVLKFSLYQNILSHN